MPTVEKLAQQSLAVEQLKRAIRAQQWTRDTFGVRKNNTKAVARLRSALKRANYDLRQTILMMAAGGRSEL